MAIRDTFRRALRRSDDSDSCQSDASTNTKSSQGSDESSILKKTSTRLTRTWTWGSHKEKERDLDKAERKAQKARGSGKEKSKRRVVHPSEKPLTAQNLKHQEMLSHFTMSFGASDPSQVQDIDFVGISPCCTRTPSLMGDGDADDEVSPNMSPAGRRSLEV